MQSEEALARRAASRRQGGSRLVRRAGLRKTAEQDAKGGGEAERRELPRMLKAMQPGDVVTVTRIDRLARSTFDLFAIVRTIRSCPDAWCRIADLRRGPSLIRRPRRADQPGHAGARAGFVSYTTLRDTTRSENISTHKRRDRRRQSLQLAVPASAPTAINRYNASAGVTGRQEQVANPYIAADRFAAAFRKAEYAMKRSGFLRPNRKDAQADWDALAQQLGTAFFAEVVAAGIAPTLVGDPPRSLGSDMVWSPPNPAPLTTVQQLVVNGVCRVRNSYIHGEKFTGGPDGAGQWARDSTLIEEAHAVLDLAMERMVAPAAAQRPTAS